MGVLKRYLMKKMNNFDINKFISCCKKYNINISKGNGKIFIDDEEIKISSIIENMLNKTKENNNEY